MLTNVFGVPRFVVAHIEETQRRCRSVETAEVGQAVIRHYLLGLPKRLDL